MSSGLQEIQQLISTGRPQEALPLATRFTHDHPDDSEGWYLLAGIHSVLGRIDEVIVCCRMVTELDPNRADAFYNLGVALQHRAKLDEGVDSYRRAISLKPDLASAHANLGMALWKLEKLGEAEAASREAIRLDPNQVQTSNTLGLILRAQNRIEEAVAVLNDVVRRAPQMSEARHNLALCLLSLDRSDEARAQIEEAIRLKPDFHEAYTELGRIDFAERRNTDAIANFKRACHLNPSDAEGWMRLAEVYLSEKIYVDAILALEHAVKLNPNWAEAHNVLGHVHMTSRNTADVAADKDAENHLRTAVKLKPDFFQAHINLASCLLRQGKHQEALDSYRRVLAISPGNSVAIGGAASVLERFGKFDEARQVLAPAIEKGIDSIALALAYATVSRYTGEKDLAMSTLEKLLTNESHGPLLRMEGHFMLGKLYDGDLDYAQAFRHYRLANELDPEIFDVDENNRSVESLVATFGQDVHHRRPRASNRSRLPVFIVGMPRSGTTLTEQILASHPLVHGAGELPHIFEIRNTLPEITGAPWPQSMDHLDQKMLDKIAQKHLDWLGHHGRGKARVTDKMPSNFFHLGVIDLLFPEARIIHCVRDPMDNCLSIYFQHFNADHAYANNLEHLGAFYRLYERLMAHWRTVLRVPMLELRYETMVSEPEQSARELIEFCGLDWDERCLRFYESGRQVATPSYDQVRQPIYKKSAGRWKRYEQYLEPLKQSLEYVDPADRLARS